MALADVIQEIEDARVDMASFSEFVFKPAGFLVTRRLAPSINTLQYYLDQLDSVDNDFSQALSAATAAAEQALSLANTSVASANTAIASAGSLIAGVTSQASSSVTAAIDASTVSGSLVTDALTKTVALSSTGIERTQRAKNAERVSVMDFGAVGNGVTDDYPAIKAAIDFVSATTETTGITRTVYFPARNFYCSQTINLKQTIRLIGETTGGTGINPTTITFAPNIDGIIVNRNNTNGPTGTVANSGMADASMISGLLLVQKGYTRSSKAVLDYNAANSQFIAFNRIRFTAGTAVKSMTDRGVVTFNATISAVYDAEAVIVPRKQLASLPIGSVLTGQTSGATGTLIYSGDKVLSYVMNAVTGTFVKGETVNTASGSFVIDSYTPFPFSVYTMTGVTGTLGLHDIVQDSTHYGTGIICRARATISNSVISAFPDNCVSILNTEAAPGNANLVQMNEVAVSNTGRHGLLVIGADSNACNFAGINATYTTGYGIKDSSFLGNIYTGCHAASNETGAYYSSADNNASTFNGCYSEGQHPMFPYAERASRYGRDSLVLGGIQASGVETSFGSGYMPTSIRGERFNISKKIYTADVGNTALTVRGGSNTPTLTIAGDGKFTNGIGGIVDFYAGMGSGGFKRDNSDLRQVGSIGAVWDKNRGASRFDFKALKPQSAAGLWTISNAPTSGVVADFMHIVVGGVLTEMRVINAGSGYTAAPTITGSGPFSGMVAECTIQDGKVVRAVITSQPTATLVDTTTSNILVASAEGLTAGVDNTTSLGSALIRFNTVFAATGAINTSDAREKSRPVTITNEVLDAWADVSLITFQWINSIENKGDNLARWHFGVIAQQVRDAFIDKGLDATAYGLLCYDEWDAQDEELDDDGNVITEYRAKGNSWGIRADQCLFLESAYQRRRAERIEQRLDDLELVVKNNHPDSAVNT